MPIGFKLNTDLRPALLVKDCTLKEVNNLSETFSNYMRRSPNQTIPPGALWAQVIINVDQFWLTEVKERKFIKETTLEEFLKIIEEVNMLKFPVHHRRMTLLEAKQVGEPLDFVRELIEFTRLAKWKTFSEENCNMSSLSKRC